MSYIMSPQNQNNYSRRVPLWIIVLVSALLIVLLGSASVVAYKKSQSDPQFTEEQTGLESRKQEILQQTDVIDLNWLRTLNPLVKNVKGRLMWSNTLQQGMMEFSNLPKLSAKQRYRLWIYDLVDDISKPITAITFKQTTHISHDFLISFNTKTPITSPLKFELILEEEGKQNGLPLLLAQP
ncbi:MAG: anti-sigma factor [Cocleimonas sp.]